MSGRYLLSLHRTVNKFPGLSGLHTSHLFVNELKCLFLFGLGFGFAVSASHRGECVCVCVSVCASHRGVCVCVCMWQLVCDRGGDQKFKAGHLPFFSLHILSTLSPWLSRTLRNICNLKDFYDFNYFCMNIRNRIQCL